MPSPRTYSASEAENGHLRQLHPYRGHRRCDHDRLRSTAAAASPVASGTPIRCPKSRQQHLRHQSHATDASTTKLTTLTVVRAPQVYTSANRDILEPNRRNWPTSGVSIGNTQFINLGLQGVGRIPANAIDPSTGESLGSISDMQISGFTKNPDGSFSGTLETLPDRGYNSGTLYSNYAARLNTFTFNFTPYTGAAPTTAQNQIALTFTGSTRFTYDHDSDPGTPPSSPPDYAHDSAGGHSR